MGPYARLLIHSKLADPRYAVQHGTSLRANLNQMWYMADQGVEVGYYAALTLWTSDLGPSDLSQVEAPPIQRS
jgi:hypothetical protein